MTNLHDNLWMPDEGYKYLTNGEIWTDSIYLGDGASVAAWHDTNDEPPTHPEPEEEATAEDYAQALRALGVNV